MMRSPETSRTFLWLTSTSFSSDTFRRYCGGRADTCRPSSMARWAASALQRHAVPGGSCSCQTALRRPLTCLKPWRSTGLEVTHQRNQVQQRPIVVLRGFCSSGQSPLIQEPVLWAEPPWLDKMHRLMLRFSKPIRSRTPYLIHRFPGPGSSYRRMVSAGLLTDANQLAVCACVGGRRGSKTEVRCLNFTSNSCESHSEPYFWSTNDPGLGVNDC